MSMTIQSSVKDKILYTLIDTSKVENAPAKMLCDLNQQMEKRADDGMTLAAQSEAFKQENSEMDDLPCGLADVVESVRDAIGFESHVLWAEIEESSLTGLELVQETTDKGKLAPRYVEPFEIVERIGSIACRLRLSEELSSVHDTFHVSNLKKRFVDANLHVSLDEIETDKTLYFVEESMGIMDREI
nr:putative reverse transcriptase domain-containing protein [Tanacetum cinerariifolium]